MKTSLLVVVITTIMMFGAPATFAANAQQGKMTECNAKAAGLKDDARSAFMKDCLSGKPAAPTAAAPVAPAPAPTAQTKQCKKGKPCGNSCIPMDKVCHKS